jgi:hypothetical protein
MAAPPVEEFSTKAIETQKAQKAQVLSSERMPFEILIGSVFRCDGK